ncbi:MAG: UDP-N-acetylmuramoyl-L-alanyl-D-glutamate--2,6-diaminopimelate ligase [Anaerolineales bacterium]|nr:UDP-N-acetylmuramoyl-L-alanyl-D-glutamate--2,6-diaminopimelate ligase [Anaerolineales bacterium]
MHLVELIDNLNQSEHCGLPEVEITSVTADSRRVQQGALFVAVRGGNADGHEFIPAAVASGAAAVVGEKSATGLQIPYIRVPDSRSALADLSAAWHGYPSQALVVIGITGTDGKSTTANLLFEILKEAGIPTGVITTVNAVIGDEVLDTGLHVTTPDALEVQGYLRRMVTAGLTHCILETTSHGLAQHRVSAIDFDLAVVTNITHEHLDYHGSYEGYFNAKAMLFEQLNPTKAKAAGLIKTAILNRDDRSYEPLRGRTRSRVVDYGLSDRADVHADAVQSGLDGLNLEIRGSGYRVAVHSPLVGAYNVSNILAAFSAAVEGLGIAPALAAKGIAHLGGVPGRMEQIDLGQPFTAIVDFAHTPNALKRALETAREFTPGRLIAVFGSAGLRDRAKRRLMAEVSAELADLTILTAEDPRTEPLEAILAEMAAGAEAEGALEGETFLRIPDRGEALRRAVAIAEPGDLVIACGKGHEQSMCFGTTEYPWDDRIALTAALSELLGVEGPQMPRLPTSPA